MSRLAIVLVAVGLVALVVAQAAFVVRVDQHAIVTQFGKPVATLSEPGLHFRIPFIQEVHRLDKRILQWDDNPQEMISGDKKRIFINTFARWRIVDPLRYFTAVRTEEAAQLNLDKIIGRSVRDVISAHVLDEVVRDSNRRLSYTAMTTFKEQKTIDIPEGSGRSALMGDVREKASPELLDSYGIELVDVQIKHLNYTESAQRETIKEMISERMVVVERYEAEGKEESERIHGQIREQLQKLQAEATKARMELEGEGQARAIAIKSAAFSEGPDLFRFLEMLRLYEESFDERTTLVLDTNSPLLTLLSGDAPTASPAPAPRGR